MPRASGNAMALGWQSLPGSKWVEGVLRVGVMLQVEVMLMDKKEKKRLEVLQQKIAKLQQLLAGAKKQPDDPAEVPRLEKELAAAHAELAVIKKS